MDPQDRPANPGEIAYEFLRDNDPASCLGEIAEGPTFPGPPTGPPFGKGKGHGPPSQPGPRDGKPGQGPPADKPGRGPGR